MSTAPASRTGTRRSPVDPAVRALQVEEVYRFAGNAAGFSYVGALFCMLVFWDTNDLARGSVWFFYASAVTLLRYMIVLSYKRREPGADVERWAKLVIFANLLAGIQWGLLGTVLFPLTHGYRELFTIMVITCFVGGSLTAYSAIRGAHQALAIPAIIPPAVYLFFVQQGTQVWAGTTALLFCVAIVYYSIKLNRHLEERFRMQVEHEDLLRVTGGVAERLSVENRELAHRAAVRGASMETARGEAERLFTHFLRLPLPVIECDGQARIVMCNAAAERLLGEREVDLVGRPLATHLVPVARKSRDPVGVDSWMGPVVESATLEVEILAHGIKVARGVMASFTRLPALEGATIPGFGVVLAAPPGKNGSSGT
ncbi:PAS domain-containing protein [Usitatibacter palustris]|uniref:PAS domain-containing protein n=1 Tax=Usitatibacter palustris TaxID=2732487 RepID=A0A6M4HC59_9PROT|nr:PAS domain-containing protein [Usitatibacter palustris]QJR16183.1 hypothetical protein DSM104440_03012 [Usitatibacter palustris]